MNTTKIKKGYTSLNGKLVKDSDLPKWYSDYRKNQNFQKKEGYKMFTLKFNKVSDKDVIEYLETQENKTDFIRSLILREMKI